MATIETLDVTKLEPRLKHPTIFKYFDALQPGEEFVIENDHDPKPLYYELIGERGDIFTWEYLEKGPEWFIVRICKNPLEEQKEVERLIVTTIEPKFKHPTIFKYFDALKAGESFIIENDHDPKPLYYELIAERGDIFTWEYLVKGPEVFEVQIAKNPLEEQKEVERLNVTAIEPKFKHPTIFKYFDALKAGESFIIENDHDPKPLYYELLAERGDIFTWEYLLQGPQLYEVQIAKNPVSETSGTIPEKDIKKAEMLKAKGVQFACSSDKKEESVKAPTYDYDKWELDFLTDYIVNTHHRYLKDNAEMLNDLSIKVSEHHGDNHPELNRLSTIMYHFLQDLIDNTVREDEVLFPIIKQMIAKQRNAETEITYKMGTLEDPINILKKDHDIAAADLLYFRNLTNNYALPVDACSSYQYLFKKIQEFESDLQTHMHLEESFLFPKAILLDQELAKLN